MTYLVQQYYCASLQVTNGISHLHHDATEEEQEAAVQVSNINLISGHQYFRILHTLNLGLRGL